MPQYSLSIRLLRQVLFCPRIPYLIETASIPHVEPQWVRQGIALHQKVSRLMKRRVLDRYGMESPELHTNVTLASDILCLHGIADAILVDKSRVFPIEFKASFESIRTGTIAQLIAYGLVAAEQFGKTFEGGAVIVGEKGKIIPVPCNDRNMDVYKDAMKRATSSIEATHLPDSSASAMQCGQCEFIKYCNDRF